MSDILKTLLTNYYDDLTDEMQPGNTLDYIRACYILHPNDTQFLDWSSPAPFLLLYVNDYTPQPDSLGCLRSDQITYQIGLSYFVEFPDENLGLLGQAGYDWKGVIDAKEDLWNLYNRNNFADASIEAVCASISFQRLGIEPLAVYHQCHLLFNHLWMDRRAAL